MLVQSLPLHSTIANLAQLCESLRQENGDLTEHNVPASMLIFDVMKAMGLPDQAVRMVLNYQEFQAISADLILDPGDPENGCMRLVRCQYCGEEADHLVKGRFGWVLVCCECEIKVHHC